MQAPPPQVGVDRLIKMHGPYRGAEHGLIPTGDPNCNHPVNWNSRHQLILYMDVSGLRTREIAARVGMHEVRVATVKTSPLYQKQKAELLEELKAKTLGTLLEQIQRDAPKNLHTLQQLRDDLSHHLGDPKVRISAAKALQHEVDRVYPRKTERSEERTVTLQVGEETMKKMVGVLDMLGKLGALEVPFRKQPAKKIEDQRPPIDIQHLDEVLAELHTKELNGAEVDGID